MRRRTVLTSVPAILALGAASSAAAAKPSALWDGLVQVKAKRFDLVYLQPGADFRGYTRVMLDPTEVSFRKNWRRDYNNSTRDLSARVSEAELQKAIARGVTAASDLFAEAWTEGGYPVVGEPAEDVLRVRTAIADISVTAPDQMTSGRSYSFSEEAGYATLIVEIRDSLTGAILGRAVDRRIAGDTTVGWRNTVTNRADFRRLVKTWATASVKGMAVLKEHSPIAADAAR